MYRDDAVRCINPFPWKYDYDHSRVPWEKERGEKDSGEGESEGRNVLLFSWSRNPQTQYDDKTFHFALGVSRGGRIISSIIIFTTAFYMLIFCECGIIGRRDVAWSRSSFEWTKAQNSSDQPLKSIFTIQLFAEYQMPTQINRNGSFSNTVWTVDRFTFKLTWISK